MCHTNIGTGRVGNTTAVGIRMDPETNFPGWFIMFPVPEALHINTKQLQMTALLFFYNQSQHPVSCLCWCLIIIRSLNPYCCLQEEAISVSSLKHIKFACLKSYKTFCLRALAITHGHIWVHVVHTVKEELPLFWSMGFVSSFSFLTDTFIAR